MPPAGLIDTGAILAIVEFDDHWHSACLEAISSIPFPLFTTEAVLTETFHLVSRNRQNVPKAWNFIRSGALAIQSITDSDLPEIQSLMLRYRDHPMDFADATLVHVANREAVSLILTIDHNDFETYRLAGNKKFTIRPGRAGKRT